MERDRRCPARWHSQRVVMLKFITACVLVSLAAGCGVTPQVQPLPRTAPPTSAPVSEKTVLGSWKLVRVNSRTTLPGIGLNFESNGMVRGTLTCGNTLLALYSVVPDNIVFRQMAVTERGCDDSPELHQVAEKTLRGPTKAYLASGHQALHIRGSAHLEFTRSIFLAEAEATRKITDLVKAGGAEAEAVSALRAAKFSCRLLKAEEYSRISTDHARMWACSTETEQSETGYKLVYANVSVDREGKVYRVSPGPYPVIYRNLRADDRGRIMVVPSQKQ